eukprot:scaffold351182_cov109-Cyclotella_meneghiniana.AAC.1
MFGFHEHTVEIKSKRRKNNQGNKVNTNQGGACSMTNNTTPCSLVEDAARSMVVCGTNAAEKKMCKLIGKERWLASYHRLHLLRHEMVFNRIIGSAISFVKNDPRHIQGKMLRKHSFTLKSIAMCNEIMTAGVHTVQFLITRSGGLEIGVIRPIEGLDTKNVTSFRVHDKFTESRRFIDYCNQNMTYEGSNHYAAGPCWVEAGDVLKAELNLNNGCIKVKKNTGAIVYWSGIGLAGPYCWCVTMECSCRWYGGGIPVALRVRRST